MIAGYLKRRRLKRRVEEKQVHLEIAQGPCGEKRLDIAEENKKVTLTYLDAKQSVANAIDVLGTALQAQTPAAVMRAVTIAHGCAFMLHLQGILPPGSYEAFMQYMYERERTRVAELTDKEREPGAYV